MQLSPLLQTHFLGNGVGNNGNGIIDNNNNKTLQATDNNNESSTSIGVYKPKPLLVAKTIPSENCMVGGKDTFVEHTQEIPFEAYEDLKVNVEMSKKAFSEIRKQTLYEKKKVLKHLEKMYNFQQKQRERKLLRERLKAEAALRAATPLITKHIGNNTNENIGGNNRRSSMSKKMNGNNNSSSGGGKNIILNKLNNTMNESMLSSNISGSISIISNDDNMKQQHHQPVLPPIKSSRRHNSTRGNSFGQTSTASASGRVTVNSDNNQITGGNSATGGSATGSASSSCYSSSKTNGPVGLINNFNNNANNNTNNNASNESEPATTAVTSYTGVDLILNEKALKEFLREMIRKDEIEYKYHDEQDF